jgi:predicted small secreted protein
MASRIKLTGATAKAGASMSVFLSLAAAVLASTLLLTGCDTAKGVGKDVQHAGQAVKHAVD